MGMNEKVASQLAGIPPSDDYRNRVIRSEYFPHALRFLQNTKALDSNINPICVWLLEDAFWLMDELAKQSCGFKSASCGGGGISRNIVPLDRRRGTYSQGQSMQMDK